MALFCHSPVSQYEILAQIRVELKCTLLDAQKIKINVGKELGHPHLLGHKMKYLDFGPSVT